MGFNPIHNRNYLGVYCGATGNGKSYAALKFACDMDRAIDFSPRFDIDRVVFLPYDFITLVKKKMPKGSFIIWDETGVEANARNFYTWKNKLISYVTQTFRFKNLGVLFTVPSMSYIDKQVRQLFHSYTEMDGVDRRAKRSYGKFFWMEYAGRTGKIYYKKVRYVEKGVDYLVDRTTFTLPPTELTEKYEEKKRKIAEQWYDLWANQLKMVKSTILKEDSSRSLNLHSLYEEIAGNIGIYMDPKTKTISLPRILMHQDIPEGKARTLIRMLNLGLEDGSIEA